MSGKRDIQEEMESLQTTKREERSGKARSPIAPGAEGKGTECTNVTSDVSDDPAKEVPLLFLSGDSNGKSILRSSSPVFYLEPEDWARSAEISSCFTPTLSPPSPLSRGSQVRSPVTLPVTNPHRVVSQTPPFPSEFAPSSLIVSDTLDSIKSIVDEDYPPSAINTDKLTISADKMEVSAAAKTSAATGVQFIIGQDEDLVLNKKMQAIVSKKINRQLGISPLARSAVISRSPLSTFSSIEETECAFDESPESDMSIPTFSPQSDVMAFPESDCSFMQAPPVLVSPPSPAANQPNFDQDLFADIAASPADIPPFKQSSPFSASRKLKETLATLPEDSSVKLQQRLRRKSSNLELMMRPASAEPQIKRRSHSVVAAPGFFNVPRGMTGSPSSLSNLLASCRTKSPELGLQPPPLRGGAAGGSRSPDLLRGRGSLSGSLSPENLAATICRSPEVSNEYTARHSSASEVFLPSDIVVPSSSGGQTVTDPSRRVRKTAIPLLCARALVRIEDI